MSQLGFGVLLAPGSLVSAVFVASTTRLGVTSGVFSRAIAIVGYIAAALLVFGVLFPFLALPLRPLRLRPPHEGPASGAGRLSQRSARRVIHRPATVR